MFFPWLTTAQLMLEAGGVIRMRLTKIACVGPASLGEALLMVNEKVDAALCATTAVAFGGTPAAVVEMYRTRVAANAQRLEAD